ncbi:hypothetical protein KKA47_02640 [bacterium]|nr:hypothetical protein [bacterium]
MITIAIIAMISGVVLTQMGDIFGTNIKKAVGRFGSTIRYLYNKSATEHLYVRLVLDIENNKYWVEATTDMVLLINPEDEEALAKAEERAKAAAEGKENPPSLLDDEESEVEAEVVPQNVSFSQVDSHLLKPQVLPEGVYFKDVQTLHQAAPVNGGKAFIYFFPNGYVEKSVINFRNDDDDVHYGIQIKPLSGGVVIHPQYYEMERDDKK